MKYARLQITERDQKILKILTKVAYIREDILARYLGLDYTTKSAKYIFHQLAGRLKNHQIIERQKIFHRGEFYWSLGENGATMIHSVVPKIMSLITVNHDDYVSEIVVNYMLENPENDVQTEYEIKQGLFGKEARERKIPDLIINETIAIEIEISLKNNKRNATLINNYLKGNYKEVIYYSNNKRIINVLKNFTKNNEKFRFLYFNKDINNSEEITDNNLKNNDVIAKKTISNPEVKDSSILKDLHII